MSQRVHSQPELSVVIAVGDQEDSIGHLIRNVASHLSQPRPVVRDPDRQRRLQRQQPVDRQRARRRRRPRSRSWPATSPAGPSCAGPPRRAATSSCCSTPASRRRWRRSPGRCRASPPGATRSCCAAATWSRAGSRCCRSSCAPAGPGVLFEAVFERRAQELGIDIVGSRPRRPVPLLLRPVLRFLAA